MYHNVKNVLPNSLFNNDLGYPNQVVEFDEVARFINQS